MSGFPAEPEDQLLAPAPGVDQERAAAAVRELLIAVGEDPDRPGLRDTPARVARSYAETFAGLWQDPYEADRKSTRLNSSHSSPSRMPSSA